MVQLKGKGPGEEPDEKPDEEPDRPGHGSDSSQVQAIVNLLAAVALLAQEASTDPWSLAIGLALVLLLSDPR